MWFHSGLRQLLVCLNFCHPDCAVEVLHVESSVLVAQLSVRKQVHVLFWTLGSWVLTCGAEQMSCWLLHCLVSRTVCHGCCVVQTLLHFAVINPVLGYRRYHVTNALHHFLFPFHIYVGVVQALDFISDDGQLPKCHVFVDQLNLLRV